MEFLRNNPFNLPSLLVCVRQVEEFIGPFQVRVAPCAVPTTPHSEAAPDAALYAGLCGAEPTVVGPDNAAPAHAGEACLAQNLTGRSCWRSFSTLTATATPPRRSCAR